MSNNSSKGASRLAGVLQNRMAQIAGRNTSVIVETGEILSGRKLKVSSLPGSVLDKDDYSVCASLQTKMPCQSSYPFGVGDQVLVVWTFDGEPVVIDKLLRADSSGALTSCKWKNTCPGLEKANKRIDDIEKDIETINEDIDTLEQRVEALGANG